MNAVALRNWATCHHDRLTNPNGSGNCYDPVITFLEDSNAFKTPRAGDLAGSATCGLPKSMAESCASWGKISPQNLCQFSRASTIPCPHPKER